MNRISTAQSRKTALVVMALLTLAAPAMATYSLVWSDEFDGTSLDTANWTPDIGTGCPDLCGWGNNELQYYRAENLEVTGGNLVITARQENFGGASFTSGKIHTRGKRSFLYGRIEMRAKIPTGGGMWPAFWMMPEDDLYGGWAASGEIDIMESANATTEVGGALHFGGSWPDNTSTSGSYSLGGANFADDFHIYAVEWEPEEIRWYVDGVLFMTRFSSQWYSDGAPGNPLAPFDQEFYIILNAAVGGNYTGCIEPGCITADLPQEYLVDYVRVYEDIDNLEPAVTITTPTAGAELPVGDILIEAVATDADGQVVRVEFYDGDTYLGEDTTAPYAFTWPAVPDGCYTIVARAVDDLGGVGTDGVEVIVGAGCGQDPFPGTPFVLPTKIEAEDFDHGGQYIAYHDTDAGNNGGLYRTDEDVDIEACSDAGGGYNVGWIAGGDWLEYTIHVPTAGEYTVEARVSSLFQGGTFHLEFDRVDRTGDIEVPPTGNWQNWTTVTTTVVLEAGPQIMRFVPTRVGFNFNYLEFQGDVSAVLPGPATEGFALHPAYPNPFNPATTLRFDLPEPATVRLTIFDMAGKAVRRLVTAEAAAAGRHEVVWNGRDDDGRIAPTGVYFYRLDAGEYSRTRRMTLVK